MGTKGLTAIENPTNGAKEDVDVTVPYVVEIEIEGTADILFHAWNNEAVAEKAGSAKGSKSKKSDNVESYVVRNDKGEIGIPGEYLYGCIANSAKFKQDPRSPRKSAMDLFKAGVVILTQLASLGKKTWDYESHKRVTIQRAGITRVRPAFKAGWKAKFQIAVNIPEYISPTLLHEVLVNAGRLVGIADFRPTYGRFRVNEFREIKLAD